MVPEPPQADHTGQRLSATPKEWVPGDSRMSASLNRRTRSSNPVQAALRLRLPGGTIAFTPERPIIRPKFGSIFRGIDDCAGVHDDSGLRDIKERPLADESEGATRRERPDPPFVIPASSPAATSSVRGQNRSFGLGTSELVRP